MRIFDAHLHIIDPRYPLIENQGYLPEPFTCEDYQKRTKKWNLDGGAVVSGSFQGFDQQYLKNALQILGDRFVGVTQLPVDTTDEEILSLDEDGIKAVRFNVKRGGPEVLAHLETFAHRIYDLAGWHVELYIESKNLPEIEGTLKMLPAVSIDHLGLTESGFDTLLNLVSHGVRVKATGFGRVNINVAQALQAIANVNPDALMFGTDLPSTRAPRPFLDADVELIQETLGEELARKVLYSNAADWYLKKGVEVKGD
ncbi:amidohydrolase family protein [Thalassobacillus devorans]|uniref:amidohydrolase family protein n=1 Tax=Thalassobacillus devorans TaxID=279813 RepID=UPI00190F806E|nr:amidohydrolase family protein [Thalassobacillus devorans]